MPVDIDRFEAAEALGQPTTSQRVIRFLATNDTQAYTRGEIADAIGAEPETVGTNLTRLKRRGLVRHHEPYWAFTDDRPHARAVLVDRYGESTVASLLDEPEVGGGESGPGTGPNDRQGTDGPDSHRPHRAAARAYIDRVHDRLGDAVEACFLFGSVARDVETASSDVDVMAVVADEADFTSVDDVLLELAYDVQLEHAVRVEVHSMRASEFADRRERGDPFVTGVLAEAEAGG